MHPRVGRLHHGVVYISGVRHDGQGRADRSNRTLNRRWVDITNGSRRAMHLDHWTLSDAEGRTYTFRHVRLDGRATVRVHTGVGRNTKTDLYQDRRTRVWDTNTDTATLCDARGRVIDTVSWGHDQRRDAAGRRHHGDHAVGHRH
ncbi:lamin tail domain-containing protein [Streptomyces sp. NPDC020192]|uniref:lamin tail domain-containing protein n=1 Tax=Streptomyces sp. NPDC020192 TaxID=3365066 RepID=UPI0037B4A361